MAYEAIKYDAYTYNGMKYAERWQCVVCSESAASPQFIDHKYKRCKYASESMAFWKEYYAFPEPPEELYSEINQRNYAENVQRALDEHDKAWREHLAAIHAKYQTHLWMPSRMRNNDSLGGE